MSHEEEMAQAIWDAAVGVVPSIAEFVLPRWALLDLDIRQSAAASLSSIGMSILSTAQGLAIEGYRAAEEAPRG